MSITMQQLTNAVFDILLKQPTQSGVITETRIKNMLNDAIDYYCSKSSIFTATFFLKEVEINGIANNREITIPSDCAVIQNVKIKQSLTSSSWTPINYSELNNVPESPDSAFAGNVYFFLNNKLVIYPTPTNAYQIKIQYTAFPSKLENMNDLISSELNRALINAVKWRTAYNCWCLLNDSNVSPPWYNQVVEWHEIAMKMLTKRKADFGTVMNFTDY